MLFSTTLLIATILVTACSSTRPQLSETDNGKTVQVKVGDQITIALEGNPSTGYTWEAANLDASMFQQFGEIQFRSSNPGLVGSGGTLTLKFVTLRAGTAPLTLVYQRPWETDVAPQSTFTVTVIVK